MKRIVLVIPLLVFALSGQSQESPTKFSALAFGDYYWVAQDHNEDLENRNGFWFRRIYLTADQTLTPKLSARLRLEANQPGDFTSSTTMQTYLKDAYLRWNSSDRLNLVVGMSPNPLTQNAEDFWGYRPIEKTPLDLYRIANTRDVGVALQGRNQNFRYHATIGNGAGIGGEVDSGKQISAMIAFDPSPFVLELYGERNELRDKTRTTAQVQVGIRRQSNRAGVLFVHHERDNVDVDLLSAFGVLAIKPNMTAVLRIDRVFDPNSEVATNPYLPLDPSSKLTLIIAGIDLKLHRNFGLIPNVEWVTYDRDGVSSDLMPRITFYYSF